MISAPSAYSCGGCFFMDDIRVPVRLGGEIKGELCVTDEGLIRRFDARCEDPGRLVRLSVYGGGKEGYLGVMEPENGALSLHRRLSRAERADFPDPIEYAAEAGDRGAPGSPSVQTQAGARNQPRRPSARAREGEPDTLWRQVGDGSLYAQTAEGSFRAIPATRYGLPAGKAVDRRRIEGVDYVIYRLRNGRIE